MSVKDRALDIANIRAVAEAELKAERIKQAVEDMKVKLRKRKWYSNILPWKIVILRREK